jgi:hypothetical protein
MRSVRFSLVAVAITLAGCESSTDTPDVDDQINEVRALTQSFSSVSAAQAAGYTVWSPNPAAANATCPSSAEGKMGYHLVNVSRRGDPANPAQGDAVIDYREPEMLLYEKRADGTLNLVGVEYIVFKAAWERVHGVGAAPPEVLGQIVPFSSHAFPPTVTTNVDHYELHVWLHSQNPNGMFSHYNPNISC